MRRGGRGLITIPQALFAEMISAAWSAYPAEAVGVLVARRALVPSRVVVLPNVGPLGTFVVDPYAQFRMERDLTTRRERVVALFHSHPEGAAALSERDLRYVFAVAPVAIVIAVATRGRCAEMAAFTTQGGALKRKVLRSEIDVV